MHGKSRIRLSHPTPRTSFYQPASSGIHPEAPPPCADAETTAVHRDGLFYFSLVTIRVEDSLFRVPKQMLEEHSHVFRDMFSMPSASDNTTVEGTSDDTPIRLDTVGKDNFKLLLKVLHSPLMTAAKIPLTLEQCKTIFELTRMWGFDNVRHIAKDRIRTKHWASIPSADKINLALEYEVEDWYFDVYHEIVTREEPLSAEEMRSLGFDLSAKISNVREKVARAGAIRAVPSGFCAPQQSATTDTVVRDAIARYLTPAPASNCVISGRTDKGGDMPFTFGSSSVPAQTTSMPISAFVSTNESPSDSDLSEDD